MKNTLALAAIFAAALAVPAMAASASTPETKTAGDMVYWFTSAPQYGLDAEGYSGLRLCHAKALDTKSIPDAVKHLDGCNQAALKKDAYYDAAPAGSRDWSRIVVKAPR